MTDSNQNLRYDGKTIHTNQLDVTLRDLLRFAAKNYTAGRSRYFDVHARDVFVARVALKLDLETREPVTKSLYPPKLGRSAS